MFYRFVIIDLLADLRGGIVTDGGGIGKVYMNYHFSDTSYV